jgi:HK97 family phage portal protein
MRAFAEIIRVDGRVTALWPLDAARMWVDRDAQLRKRWTYTGHGRFSGYNADGTWSAGGPANTEGTMQTWTFDASQPPIFELTHESPIGRCREIIGTALALQEYVGRFFSNGAQPKGVLSTAAKLTPAQQQSLREQWQSKYAGAPNAHHLAILTGGLEFKNTSVDNDAAQMAETMKALATAICGAFRIPPWKAGITESTNYSNMESGERTYITSTLDPLFECWEEALRRDVLTVRQFGAYTVQFDRSALARNDLAALNTSLQAGINSGYLSQNDCRRALGLNPIADGDVYRVNSALQPVGAPREPTIA